jgi:hypothetical protein
LENSKGRGHSEELVLDYNITFKLIFKIYVGEGGRGVQDRE